MPTPLPPVTPSLWPVAPAPTFAEWVPPAPKPPATPPKKRAKTPKPTRSH